MVRVGRDGEGVIGKGHRAPAGGLSLDWMS